jgi:hypothetical protein
MPKMGFATLGAGIDLDIRFAPGGVGASARGVRYASGTAFLAFNGEGVSKLYVLDGSYGGLRGASTNVSRSSKQPATIPDSSVLNALDAPNRFVWFKILKLGGDLVRMTFDVRNERGGAVYPRISVIVTTDGAGGYFDILACAQSVPLVDTFSFRANTLYGQLVQGGLRTTELQSLLGTHR